MTTRLCVCLSLLASAMAAAAPAHAENFEGPFVGAAIGYSRDDIGPDLGDGDTIDAELDRDAVYFQAFAGYDHAITEKARIGFEAAFGIGAEDDLSLSDATGSIELDPEYTFEFTGRAGYLVAPNALLYARGGYQNSRVEVRLEEAGSPVFRDKDNVDGWLVGGGLEYAFGSNLRSRIEYRYSDLGNDGAEWDRHQVLAGVLWNF
ncbi:outer membrane protein [Erythrobacter sp. JK5]|uniref:outer membrane protein n=1 Tax=Erythrobacter sp. JK5 TaxID=2829500 RepID=UPI001BA89BBA|nr:porin family protein [Erythrobacter sp. JK5]QUL38981.1 porin family protein [Erythrobacter sp. JK5]